MTKYNDLEYTKLKYEFYNLLQKSIDQKYINIVKKSSLGIDKIDRPNIDIYILSSNHTLSNSDDLKLYLIAAKLLLFMAEEIKQIKKYSYESVLKSWDFIDDLTIYEDQIKSLSNDLIFLKFINNIKIVADFINFIIIFKMYTLMRDDLEYESADSVLIKKVKTSIDYFDVDSYQMLFYDISTAIKNYDKDIYTQLIAELTSPLKNYIFNYKLEMSRLDPLPIFNQENKSSWTNRSIKSNSTVDIITYSK